MMTLLIVGTLILLPFIFKALVVYLGYIQWALKTSPIKIDLSMRKPQSQPKKKQQIGFPAIIPEQVVVAEKKKIRCILFYIFKRASSYQLNQ